MVNNISCYSRTSTLTVYTLTLPTDAPIPASGNDGSAGGGGWNKRAVVRDPQRNTQGSLGSCGGEQGGIRLKKRRQAPTGRKRYNGL